MTTDVPEASRPWIAAVTPQDATDPSGMEVVAALLWQAGAATVTLHHDHVRAVFDTRADLSNLAVTGDGSPNRSRLTIAWQQVVDQDHMAAWRAASVPVTAGVFELVPSHLTATHDTPDELHRIVMDAGMAFGSGHHETTSGCLDALGRLPVSGARVADIGTGSGVLGIGAALLGAAEVVAVDIDPDAVAIAGRNATANGVQLQVTVGSTEATTGRFDIVLANLLTGLLTDMAGALAALVRPGGHLVASGTSNERAESVAHALIAAGLVDVVVHPGTQWAVVTARR